MKLPDGYSLIEYQSTDSTNLEAKRLIQSGMLQGKSLVILAKIQTGGRGRLGRSWVSLEGNLFVSIVRNHSIPYLSSLIPFAVAIAVGETVSKFIDKKPLYKWPNDVLVLGEKISGILIETIADSVVIGIGMNIANYPTEGTKLPATCLNEHANRQIQVNEVLETLIHKLDQWFMCNHADILNEWVKNAYGIGKEIAVQQEKRQIMGVFRGIDENGWLILETKEGTRELISFGDVVFGKLESEKTRKLEN